MKSKAAYKIPKAERDAITSIISEVLHNDNRVIFSYLYGSFITGNFFNDIDIFVFIRKGEDQHACSVSIKEKLFCTVNKAGFGVAVDDFDVRVINDSTYDFTINLLCDGILIVDKDPEFRKDYIEYVSNEYRVNYFILDEAYT